MGFLCVKCIGSKQLLMAMPAPTWPPVANYNSEILQMYSGQKVWKYRQDYFEKLRAERAGQVLGGDAASSSDANKSGADTTDSKKNGTV